MNPSISPPREYLHYHRVCPLRSEPDGTLLVAVAPDASPAALAEMRDVLGVPIRTQEVDADELERMIERQAASTADDLQPTQADPIDGESIADVRDLANKPPVVAWINYLLRDAYAARASDIHVEAHRRGLRVRYRLDGVLRAGPVAPRAFEQAIYIRLKVLGALDIAERRRAQDGRFRVVMDAREVDVRVSTVPTIDGESVVLRILDHGGRPVQLDELGMSELVRATFEPLVRKASGLVLVTGPTGSGKTSTLYSALGKRDVDGEKVITVEDPVEYRLPGVNQVAVTRDVGVAFGNVLRSILRQDPDVIMIGEMRDPETAEIAVQAAMTGHLVLSTLHTSDALGAIARLRDLGVPNFLLSATLEGVLAQRLVRKLCTLCRVPSPRHEHDRLLSGPIEDVVPSVFSAGACDHCRNTGYAGRTGIFELVRVTEALRAAIGRNASAAELRTIAVEDGWRPLRHDALEKAALGITSMAEVERVLQ